MSEEPEKTEEASDGPVGGERLRAARRENNISVRDIAKELGVSVSSVEKYILQTLKHCRERLDEAPRGSKSEKNDRNH